MDFRRRREVYLLLEIEITKLYHSFGEILFAEVYQPPFRLVKKFQVIVQLLIMNFLYLFNRFKLKDNGVLYKQIYLQIVTNHLAFIDNFGRYL